MVVVHMETLFDTVVEAKDAFNNKPFYLKHELENDIVKESYVCFEKDSNTYFLRGGVNESSLSEKPIYESNKTILKNAFGESNCTQNSSGLQCSAGGLIADATEDGQVDVDGDSAGCFVYSYGASVCTW